ncbi:nitroreductase [Altibacter sp.]|uniref:nitroreductase family protein n=1 Tax=Altibacter sp. TaxID=2024823 RepID=UPI00258D9B08|nr:nitroreductase [Altibacter sp.]MCW9037065.1 nitroreductase [Altibacter sp.]
MIHDTIRNRRAVFPVQYNTEEITKEEIQQVLEAANWAPTHRRTEPWRFKVFYGPAKEKLSAFLAEKYRATASHFSEFKHNKTLQKPLQSGCVIAICMQRDPAASVPEWEEVAATAMAVQNMWLTAHELNIGAYWSSPAAIHSLEEIVPLSEGERCLGFFFMGKYDGPLPEGFRNSSIEEKTVWV